MKIITTILLAWFTMLLTHAVPARPGIWRLLTLSDGSSVKAELQGDESLHFWRSEDGRTFVNDNGIAREIALENMSRRRAQKARAIHASRAVERKQQSRAYTGKKRGLIILVEFSDKKFRTGNDQALYNCIANEPDFHSPDGFRGSVRDYFLAQSNGLFDLSFDVVGPVSLPKSYAYYGENDHDQDDMDKRAGEMVAEACKLVNSIVDFSTYDWDNNGEVDQVVVIYAGYGENASTDPNTVWPHEFALQSSDYGQKLKLDGKFIDIYACTSELSGTTKRIDGIGTICHEFSHCLGLPDYYDTQYSGNYGLGHWSIMSGGSYNNNGFCPAGYTSIDKWMCGWQYPIELTGDTTITDMKPLSEGGDAYILSNSGYDNEFYLLENRQKTQWDSALPGSGLLILHVDYDGRIWAYNEPNVTKDATTGNDHQRCTIFHADNKAGDSRTNELGDPYPYAGNDSLTPNSKPQAMLYHANAKGLFYMDKAITGITRLTNNTMGFTISQATEQQGEETPSENILFYESFSQCNSTGGNDSKWSGNIASSMLTTDNDGWEYEYGRAADHCARFGSSSVAGITTTPVFSINGEATLTFMAAPWVSSFDSEELQASIGIEAYMGTKPTMSPTTFQMKQGEWTKFSATIKGRGRISITFKPGKRFFLDEVKVVDGIVSAINDVPLQASPLVHRPSAIYTLDGRKAGTSLENLKPGLYIRNGKVIVK